MNRRWYDAIHFEPGKFEAFWSERLRDTRELLMILGLGWDPRMTATASVIKSFGRKGRRDLHLIRFSPSKVFRSPHEKYIDKNYRYLNDIANGWASITESQIETRREDNHYIGDENISEIYRNINLCTYNDIIVDISSLPKSLYFPLLLVIVRKCIRDNEPVNIHVTACQDTVFDNNIVESADDTRFLKGFRGGLSMVSKKGVPRIWVPILATNNSAGLTKLYALQDLSPIDIYRAQLKVGGA